MNAGVQKLITGPAPAVILAGVLGVWGLGWDYRPRNACDCS